MTPLRIRERPGHYRVDRHVDLLFPKKKGVKPAETIPMVEAMRREINRAAQIAVARTQQELEDRPQARALARKLVKALDKVQPLLDADLDDLAAGFVAVKQDRSAARAIEQIGSWTRYLGEEFRLIEPSPSRSDPLARNFIEALVQIYIRYRGEPAPCGRSGPFVDLVVDGWIDLCFVTEQEQKKIPDLDRWIGHKIENRGKRLARERRKKP